MSDYNQEAEDDARNMLDYLSDEIIEQARDDGEASTDLFNDYHGADSYHHENHVDKSYSLSNAARLLEQLADDEETDHGLWDGQAPREAISTQAAYTYGNAVYSRWRQLIGELNEEFLHGVEGEGRRAAIATLWLHFTCHHSGASLSTDGQRLTSAAIEDLESDSLDGARVLADFLQEQGTTATLQEENTIRAALSLADDEEAARLRDRLIVTHEEWEQEEKEEHRKDFDEWLTEAANDPAHPHYFEALRLTELE